MVNRMAISIPLASISRELQEEICNLNTFHIIKQYNRNTEYGPIENNYFSVFRTITINDIRATLVPFYFGNRYISIHPEISPIKNEFYRHGCSYKFTGQLRHYQEAAVVQARLDLSINGTCTIALHAGAGKTVTSSAIFSEFDGIVAVVIHLDTLITQWVETFNRFTDAKVHVYGEKKNKYTIEEANVWIVMEKRIIKLVEEDISDWVRIVLVDEAHHFCTVSRAQALLGFRPEYLVMITATPTREDGLHEVMYAFVGTHQIYRPYNVTFEVHRIKTDIIPIREFDGNGTLNYSIFSQSLMYHEIRNTYITNLVEINRGRKILILSKEKKHVDTLNDMISSRNILVATMRGKDKSYTDADVLIGTVSKIGCGFDEATFASCYNGKRLDMLIFLSSYKNPNTIEQSVGRILRSENPVIVYLNDRDNICDNHWKVFRNWSESNNGVCYSYQMNLEDSHENLTKYHIRPISKIKVLNPEVRLWISTWGDSFSSVKEVRRGGKKKKLIKANQVQV